MSSCYYVACSRCRRTFPQGSIVVDTAKAEHCPHCGSRQLGAPAARDEPLTDILVAANEAACGVFAQQLVAEGRYLKNKGA
ncbi:MAG: hypothetical protein LBB50_02270 [Oscillospiraceae bacterium]|nr:hypothetical protein [Oscillospiraceae bacterium]